jgi:hypothetical protein
MLPSPVPGLRSSVKKFTIQNQPVILSHVFIIYDDISALKLTLAENHPIHREESFSEGLMALASSRSMAGDTSRCV